MEFRFEAAKLERWMVTTPKEIRAGLIRALRRTGTAVQGTAIELFTQRGVGRKVFGKKSSGARKIIRRGKLRIKDGAIEQPIVMSGLAAIQERGGHIKAHIIKPKLKKVMRFGIAGAAGFGGDAVFAPEVKHPGANMPAIPVLERAAARHMNRFREEVDIELAKAVGNKAA